MRGARPWRGVSAPAPPSHYRRLAVLVGCIALTLGGMVVRLVDIQVVQAERIRENMDQSRFRTQVATPLRGRFVDRDRRSLAYSVLVKEVRADPFLVGPQFAEFLARRLAGPLEMEPGELRDLLASNYRTNVQGTLVPDRYALLRKDVTQEQWEQVRKVLEDLDVGQNDPSLTKEQLDARRQLLKGLRASITAEPRDRQIRVYPGGRLACHVLGLVGHNPKAGDKEVEPFTIGVEGLECVLNTVLRGTPGWQMERRVSRGGRQFYEIIESFRGRPGLDVMLTLDARVQAIVEEEMARAFDGLQPTGMSCVVLVPETGEILAMANLPNFDPNDYADSEASWRRNRAVTDAFEPGSTFKVLSVAVAMEANVVRLEDRVDCEQGAFTPPRTRRTIHDMHPYGVLDVKHVLAKSSNIGAAKIGLILGEARLYQGLRRFGIGEKTGVPLMAESDGVLRPLEAWNPRDSILSVPMGHEVMATPLQMTAAVSAIASGGRLMRPYLIRQVMRNTGETVVRYGPSERGRAVSERVALEMTRGLQAVVDEPGGTGGQARLEHYTVAGKTGTADKWKNGKLTGRHFASFIGFFPVENPRLCIGVFVDEPKGGTHYGGTTAAPVFREIATRAAAVMGIPPSPSRLAELAQGGDGSHLTGSLARSRM